VPGDAEQPPLDPSGTSPELPQLEQNPTHGVHFDGRNIIHYEERSALPDGVEVMRVEGALLVSNRLPKKTPEGVSMTSDRIKRFLRLEVLERTIARGEPLPPSPKISLTKREIAQQVMATERPLLPGKMAIAQLTVVRKFGTDTYAVPAAEQSQGPYERKGTGIWLPIYRK